MAGRILTGNFIFVITFTFEKIALHPLVIQGDIKNQTTIPPNIQYRYGIWETAFFCIINPNTNQ